MAAGAETAVEDTPAVALKRGKSSVVSRHRQSERQRSDGVVLRHIRRLRALLRRRRAGVCDVLQDAQARAGRDLDLFQRTAVASRISLVSRLPTHARAHLSVSSGSVKSSSWPLRKFFSNCCRPSMSSMFRVCRKARSSVGVFLPDIMLPTCQAAAR